MKTIKDFWIGLTATQRTIVIVAIATLALGALWSFIFFGTDYSGFGDWIGGFFGNGGAP